MRRRVRHAVVRNCELNACGTQFTVDGDGYLTPDPTAELAAVLEQLANYTVELAELEPEPEPKPKPKPKRRRTRQKSEE